MAKKLSDWNILNHMQLQPNRQEIDLFLGKPADPAGSMGPVIFMPFHTTMQAVPFTVVHPVMQLCIRNYTCSNDLPVFPDYRYTQSVNPGSIKAPIQIPNTVCPNR